MNLNPITKLCYNPLVHIFLILLIGVAAYSNTFHAPFQLDEGMYICGNPFVKDITTPAKALQANPEIYKTVVQRWIGYLTFALNYRVHGLRVEGYHFVNLVIHILNALLVYLLVHLTFQTPYLTTSPLKQQAGSIGLVSSLFFVAHPLQTEAVTYIMQRLASLVAFFYLLSMVLYVRWRLADGAQESGRDANGLGNSYKRRSLWAYGIALISAIFAMKTKENAFTLPIMLMLYETVFFQGKFKKRAKRLLPFLGTLLVIPVSTIILLQVDGVHFTKLTTGGDSAAYAWSSYLITQLRVIMTYYRLLVLPVNQNLLYDYPVYTSLLQPVILLSLLCHSGILTLSVYLLYRSKHGGPSLRVISFGILWFYIALAMESSIIPLPNLIFEYRVYLPSSGFFIMVTTATFLIVSRLGLRTSLRSVVLALSMLLTCMVYATYARNELWTDNVRLWEDIVRKSPNNAKARNNLGTWYDQQGNYSAAIREFETSLTLAPNMAGTYLNLGNAYDSKGLTKKAIEFYLKAIDLNPWYADAYNDLGSAYSSVGLLDQALESYKTAIRLNPASANAYNNLANAHYQQGAIDKAIGYYQMALNLDPDLAETYNNLGRAFYAKGLIEEAIKNFDKAIMFKPGIGFFYVNRGDAHLKVGLLHKAAQDFRKACDLGDRNGCAELDKATGRED